MHLVQRLRGDEAQFDALPDEAAEHVENALDQLIQVDIDGLNGLASAEGEQLLRQLSGALGGPAHLLDLIPGRRARRLHALYKADIPENDLEQIVEVVGHAARELAHGIHLLRLPQLVLQASALADVADVALDDPVVPHMVKGADKLNGNSGAIRAEQGDVVIMDMFAVQELFRRPF